MGNVSLYNMIFEKLFLSFYSLRDLYDLVEIIGGIDVETYKSLLAFCLILGGFINIVTWGECVYY